MELSEGRDLEGMVEEIIKEARALEEEFFKILEKKEKLNPYAFIIACIDILGVGFESLSELLKGKFSSFDGMMIKDIESNLERVLEKVRRIPEGV